MAPIVLRVKGEDFTFFEGIESGEELARTWKVCTKVKDALESGSRLENLSWRLWHLHHHLVESHRMDDSQFRELTKEYSKKLGQEGTTIQNSPRNSLMNVFQGTDTKHCELGQPKASNQPDAAEMEKKLFQKFDQLMLNQHQQQSQHQSLKLQKYAEMDRQLQEHDQFLVHQQQQQLFQSHNLTLLEQDNQLNSFSLLPEPPNSLSPLAAIPNTTSNIDLELMDADLMMAMSSDPNMLMNISNLQLLPSPILESTNFMEYPDFTNLPSDLESWSLAQPPMLGFEFSSLPVSEPANNLLPMPWYLENVPIPDQNNYISEIPVSSPLPQLSPLSPPRPTAKSPKGKTPKITSNNSKSSKISKKQKEIPTIKSESAKDNSALRTASSAASKVGPMACCQNCHVTSTPLWRRSQDDELLCNACGLYLKLHKVMRPKTMRTQIVRKDQNGEQLATCYNCRTKNTPLWRRDNDGNTLCNACGLYLKLHFQHRPVTLKNEVVRKRPKLVDDDGDYEDVKEIKETPKMKVEVDTSSAAYEAGHKSGWY